MVNMGDAQRAREALTGSMVHDRRVRVDFSLTSKAHSPTPGKYKGQDTGSSAFHDRGAYRHRADDGYRSHRSAPYRPRRRANTRDRRREDHMYKHSQGDHYSRSKSPGFQNAQRPSDSFRRGPPSYANSDRDRESYANSDRDRESYANSDRDRESYANSDRNRESYANSDRNRKYLGRRMNGYGSPQRSNTYEQGYDRGYSQRSGTGERQSDYRSGPHSRPSY
ncbi:hypothetical protein GGH96_005519 [Coemansia sp. RSA 1972]|nr:hypothetical protein GGH96_005519 [Coemansia sp. RSA 1972]